MCIYFVQMVFGTKLCKSRGFAYYRHFLHRRYDLSHQNRWQRYE